MATNYSRQLDKYIDSTLYATSFYKQTDLRTWVSYFIDSEGLIHSDSFNYSIIGSKPATVQEFAQRAAKDIDTTVSIIQ